MILEAGTRLGPYEILEPLGAGGMGEVPSDTDTTRQLLAFDGARRRGALAAVGRMAPTGFGQANAGSTQVDGRRRDPARSRLLERRR